MSPTRLFRITTVRTTTALLQRDRGRFGSIWSNRLAATPDRTRRIRWLRGISIARKKLFKRANKMESMFADDVMALKGLLNVVDIRTAGDTIALTPPLIVSEDRPARSSTRSGR